MKSSLSCPKYIHTRMHKYLICIFNNFHVVLLAQLLEQNKQGYANTMLHLRTPLDRAHQ